MDLNGVQNQSDVNVFFLKIKLGIAIFYFESPEL